MALPSSGPLGLQMAQNEFGGSHPIRLTEFYGLSPGIPTSGQISFSDLRGKSADIYIGVQNVNLPQQYLNFEVGEEGHRPPWDGLLFYHTCTLGTVTIPASSRQRQLEIDVGRDIQISGRISSSHIESTYTEVRQPNSLLTVTGGSINASFDYPSTTGILTQGISGVATPLIFDTTTGNAIGDNAIDIPSGFSGILTITLRAGFNFKVASRGGSPEALGSIGINSRSTKNGVPWFNNFLRSI